MIRIMMPSVHLHHFLGTPKILKLFENRMLKRIFVSKIEETTVELIKSHNEEIHNFCSSQYIIREIMLRKMRCVGYAEMRDKKCIPNFVKNPEGRRLLGRLDLDLKIILKLILNMI
jgi:hypothetical protein